MLKDRRNLFDIQSTQITNKALFTTAVNIEFELRKVASININYWLYIRSEAIQIEVNWQTRITFIK